MNGPRITKGLRLVVGSPNRIELSFPPGKFGMAIQITDLHTGATRELSVSDLANLVYDESE